MKRDMELIRKLLIDFSEGRFQKEFDPCSIEDQIYIYHLKILKQAGLIEYNGLWSDMIPKMYLDVAPTLTWSGNDYLDAISNENIWNKTKSVIKSKGLEIGSMPFSVLKEYTTIQIKQLIGLE